MCHGRDRLVQHGRRQFAEDAALPLVGVVGEPGPGLATVGEREKDAGERDAVGDAVMHPEVERPRRRSSRRRRRGPTGAATGPGAPSGTTRPGSRSPRLPLGRGSARRWMWSDRSKSGTSCHQIPWSFTTRCRNRRKRPTRRSSSTARIASSSIVSSNDRTLLTTIRFVGESIRNHAASPWPMGSRFITVSFVRRARPGQ